MTLVQLHLVATLLMLGLIWTVQLVHYPLLARVGPEYFVDYELEHCARISWLVGPWMGTELATAVLIALRNPQPLAWLSLLSVLTIWVITGLEFGPLHSRLCQRFDASDHARLVRLNWWRTFLWSLRLPIVLAMAF
ncbi:hypothetical protein JST97_36045 [bacterium]|nr:hypothetical protein [bacterium]